MEDKNYIRTDKGYIFYNLSSKQISGLKLLSKQYGSILKHSKNIIDLIECGDIIEDRNQVYRINNIEMLDRFRNNDYIKSIVTKEQFENVEYKVESEDN